MSINLQKLFQSLKEVTEPEGAPAFDVCQCSECGWEGPVADCESEWEQESWECPQWYLVHACPVCEDGGCIDNYSYSDEMFEELERRGLLNE